jgi:hypothetical protein
MSVIPMKTAFAPPYKSKVTVRNRSNVDKKKIQMSEATQFRNIIKALMTKPNIPRLTCATFTIPKPSKADSSDNPAVKIDVEIKKLERNTSRNSDEMGQPK